MTVGTGRLSLVAGDVARRIGWIRRDRGLAMLDREPVKTDPPGADQAPVEMTGMGSLGEKMVVGCQPCWFDVGPADRCGVDLACPGTTDNGQNRRTDLQLLEREPQAAAGPICVLAEYDGSGSDHRRRVAVDDPLRTLVSTRALCRCQNMHLARPNESSWARSRRARSGR